MDQRVKRSLDNNNGKAKKVKTYSEGKAAESKQSAFLSMDAYSRHKCLINHYVLTHPGATEKLKRNTDEDKNDLDVLLENHQFIWDEEEEESSADQDSSQKNSSLNWGQKIARKYYERLIRDYGICDLSGYKENKIAMRWRIEKEVIQGKGQFICGNKACNCEDHLTSWEVNFAYMEKGVKKNALIKIRLCFECSDKLNYRQQKRQVSYKPVQEKVIQSSSCVVNVAEMLSELLQ